jgi:putative lipase involved disintegration of autophagic bodies
MSNKTTTTKKTADATAANAPGTALAVNFNAADRMQLVQQELKKLQKIAETAYNTQDKTILGVVIPNETSIEKLISLDASVKSQQNVYVQSMADKIQKGYIQGAKPFEVAGVSADGIIKDIDLRLQVLSFEERRAKLQKFADGYKELVSRDEKIQMLDKEFGDFLGQ